MAIISDVARLAGVSTTTVSRHLAGKSVRRADAVQSAIAELNFWPSQVARTLKSGVTRSVGVVVPDVTNPFFAAVVKGVESVSRQLALNIFLSNTDESVELERALLHELVGRVDGVILAPAKAASDNTHGLRRAGVPIVLLDRQLTARTELDCVLIDNEGGAARAVEHLVELGHERIGFISGPLDTTPGRGRHQGYLAVSEAAGLELEPGLTQMGDFKRESGYQATLRLLGLPRPPTAIFAANNLMSIGALQALHHMGVRVPQQLSFIGFDDLELGELLSPPLTAVSRPMAEQGVLAMRLLANRIDRASDPEPRNIVLETRLVTRRSCGPPPNAEPAPRSSVLQGARPQGKDTS
jgi:DNA-binding LacI/PurR family transcriptional regulator